MAAKRKRLTLSEFKAWLQGVEELQPKGWSPTAEQWALVRSKIELISESSVTVTRVPVNESPVPNYGTRQAPPQQFNGAGFIPPAPPAPGGIPVDAVLTGVTPKLGSMPLAEGIGGPGGPSSFT